MVARQNVGDLERVVYQLRRDFDALRDELNAGPLTPDLESPWAALEPDAVRIWRFGRVRVLSGILKSDATGKNVCYFPEPDAPEREADGMAGILIAAPTDAQRVVRVSPVGAVYFASTPPSAAGGRYYLPAITWLAQGA